MGDHPRVGLRVFFHPFGRVLHGSILPGGEPKQHQAHVALAGICDELVDVSEVEPAAVGFDLFPIDGHFGGIGF